MQFSKWNKIAGWSVFGIALIAYIATAQRTVMFWDSGEFIASIYKIQPTHPPGAPLYTLLGRIFIMLFPTSAVAFAGAVFSALCAAFTIWFLYHAIIWLALKITSGLSMEGKGPELAVLASGVVGALSLTFNDSFWVSSTEAEVYTLSTLFMATAFWAATRWESQFGQAGNDRWLLLIVYLLGLSIGVHILNLAILFPVIMLVVLKKYGLTFKSIIIALSAALVLFVVFNRILVQGIVKALIGLEIVSVNNLGLSQHSGVLMGAALFFILVITALIWARLKRKFLLERITAGLLLFTIGWSTYATAIIRTNVNTPVSNNAYDVFRLLDYLRSDQFGFGNQPLFFGPTFNSPRDGDKEFVDAEPVSAYDEEQKRYVVSDDGKLKRPNYHKDAVVFFPRMYSFEPLDIQGYQQWIDYEGKEISVQVRGPSGKLQNVVIPTVGENLSFFFTLQLNWLNFRYLMWNYAGRQNDIKGIGIPSSGNWVSGIPFIDKGRIGSAENIPEFYKKHKALNEFYLLPFLLGLAGLFFLFKTGKKELIITALFFLAFGVAITIFINQRPIHILIRERDYIFLGSYYVFSIWIGLGVLALFHWLSDKWPAHRKALAVTLIGLLIPGLMAFKGWDDHDRSHNNEARNLAKNTLDQCAPNSILIALGDNIIFPLWYMQEVEGYRTDVRVLEYTLMNLHWYIERMQTAVNQSPRLKLSLPGEFYQKGKPTVFPLRKNPNIKNHVDVKNVIDYLVSSEKNGHFPTDLFGVQVNDQPLETAASSYGALRVPQIRWQFSKQRYTMQDVALLDLIAHNIEERAIYFTTPQAGLNNYLLDKGMVKQLLPITLDGNGSRSQLVDTKALHQLLMEELHFEEYRDTNRFVPAINYDFTYNVYRPAFYKLAQAYLETGKVIKSKEVLDRAREVLPNANIPYKGQMFEMAKLYHQLGYFAEWKEISRTVMNNLTEEMRWYTSFYSGNELITYTKAKQLGEQLSVIMTGIGQRDAELTRELEPQLDELKSQYNAWVLNDPIVSRKHLQQ